MKETDYTLTLNAFELGCLGGMVSKHQSSLEKNDAMRKVCQKIIDKINDTMNEQTPSS